MDLATFRIQALELVQGSSHIVISAHAGPDDDSIGSVLSVYTILHGMFPEKDIRIIYTGDPVTRYKCFKAFEKIEWVEDIADHLNDTDLFIMLDVNRFARVSKKAQEMPETIKTICIDHHSNSVHDSFTLELIDSTYTSNSELIYHAFNIEETLTPELAEYILLGVLGDTGNFRYIGPKQTEVFDVAKKLIEVSGVAISEFRSRYGGIPKEIIPLLQDLVKNTTYKEITGWPALQYSYISREVAEQGNYTDEDISAASHIYISQYLTQVVGYNWGFVITPRSNGACRISARSLPGSVNVRDMHERMGVGAGHDRAAGGEFKESNPEQCVETVFTWMSENTPVLK